MSKLSRTVLKEIVKECIIEIFEESFFTQGSLVNESRQISATKSRSKKRPRHNNTQKQNHLDNISYQNSNNSKFNKKIDNITSNLTSDPVMADIFKDTASTTLQQQNESTGRQGMVITGGDAASMQANKADPSELFAESAGKWAALAFADPIKR